MEDNQKDSPEPQNTLTGGNINELVTEEEKRSQDHIRSFIEHLQDLTGEFIAKRRKAVLQFQNAVKIKEDWIHEYVMWQRRYDSNRIELAELVTPKSPRRQRWQGL
ncbi:hypothetical protein LOTGIDRAFT_228922 [Lottia gigantea]|uniref:Uncharacterized protein n=1 Tax=Lottia gigantea TaxID=225164 RepID=V4BK75_LOTGI|nr:hypothetical protein LOTGIDRAFT_228922 [Lottia gigantea]ESO88969.1 hypothetical protein LOTGIDRAFT_228922 [Lottia gigantea]